jgi:alpha-N-arabinofuranosidase
MNEKMMNAKMLMLAAAPLWLVTAVAITAQQAALPVPSQLKVTIDTQQTSAPVSKYIYGQFIEHIGSTMYSSLWAEMLDDRKFYFPITAEARSQAQPEGGPLAA